MDEPSLPTIKSRVIKALEDGADTSRSVAAAVGISVTDASAHLCVLRKNGIARVTGTRPSLKEHGGNGGRAMNIWELVTDD